MRRADREVVARNEQEAILRGARVCHLGIATDGPPYVVPLNFGVEWTGDLPVLWFHSASAGRKLDLLRTRPEVGFTVDTGHELVLADAGAHCTMRYRCVMGTGTVTEVTDLAEKLRALGTIMRQYTNQEDFDFPPQVVEATTILRLEVKGLTAKERK